VETIQLLPQIGKDSTPMADKLPQNIFRVVVLASGQGYGGSHGPGLAAISASTV
jgi:hypothetical protein